MKGTSLFVPKLQNNIKHILKYVKQGPNKSQQKYNLFFRYTSY